MSKQSGVMKIVMAYKEELDKVYTEKANRSFRFCEQWYTDQAIIAAAETLTDDPDKLREFCTVLEKNRNSFVNDIWNADTEDVEYSMSVLDRSLEQVCGKYFVPYEKRYDDKIWLIRVDASKKEKK